MGLHPFRHINPGVGGGKIKFKSRDAAFTAVFAALYAAGVVLLAPISFGVYQIRVADALLPLSMIFGMPVAVGTGLGCLVANVYGGLGIVDIFGGALANFAACTLAWHFGRDGLARRLLGCFIETAVITAIVGGYLSLIFEVPLELGLFGIFAGSIVAINILGFALLEGLLRSGIRKSYAENGAPRKP
ncbi:MAG: QueT transporter family protein [Nitrososphaerota archaeon]|nr:QueT transporter family protein [Candidatus Bathyarchaeota archaeon]MDW8022154.1 QueT transporter family protein [Nitrososphaerota archaeon]